METRKSDEKRKQQLSYRGYSKLSKIDYNEMMLKMVIWFIQQKIMKCQTAQK